ncbi:MAG TPA: hypothetical protein VGP72_05960 [Planctomycetota bacterium]
MQKLVTVMLDPQKLDATPQEHLQNYLAEGWVIKSVSPVAAEGPGWGRAWMVVLLEKA